MINIGISLPTINTGKFSFRHGEDRDKKNTYQPRGASRELIDSTLTELIISGPAGTGKTRSGLEKVHHVAREYPGARILIVRKTRASLTETAMVTYERDVLGYANPIVANGPRRNFRQNYTYPNQSEVVVGGMDKPGKVLSSEYDLVYVPQAEEIYEDDWETLVTRLRSTATPFQQIIGDCNPMGPSHWIMQRSIQGHLKLLQSHHQDNPLLWDEAKGDWTPFGREYMAKLDLLTGTRRERLLEGKWVQAAGLVYVDFDLANITDDEPDLTAPFELGIDDGYIDPRAILFIQRTPSKILVFDEIYHSHHLAETCVKEILTKCVALAGRETPEGWGGWGLEAAAQWCRGKDEATGRQRVAMPEIAMVSPEAKELQGRLRMADIPARKAVNDILPGIDAVRATILDGNGVRTLQVNRRCKNLIREFTEGYLYPEGSSRKNSEVPIDKENHACLVAGTLIETKEGPKPIERMTPGEWVMTRQGYRQVVAAGMTEQDALVKRIEFSDGRSLIATGNHLVWIKGCGFLTVDQIEERLLWEGKAKAGLRPLLIRELSFADTPIPSDGRIGTITAPVLTWSKQAWKRSIGKFIRIISGPSRKASTSTTKTRTHRITTHRTWRQNQAPSMGASTENRISGETQRNCKQTWIGLGWLLPRGIDRSRVGNGTVSTEKKPGLIANLFGRSASSAVVNLKRWLTERRSVIVRITARAVLATMPGPTTSNGFAQGAEIHSRPIGISRTDIAPVRALRVTAIGRRSVFNLQVEGAHEYFANGLLVHNCDGYRYWVMTRGR
jgi:hypothetical protein